jgi:hypothetical protein
VAKSGNANNAAQVNIRSMCDLPARDNLEYPLPGGVQPPHQRGQSGWKEAGTQKLDEYYPRRGDTLQLPFKGRVAELPMPNDEAAN